MSTLRVQAIILAAGKSSRFKTNRSKLLEKLCGQEMIMYPLAELHKLHIPTSLIVGFFREQLQHIVTKKFPSTNFILQEHQHGTGHALLQSRNYWHADTILVLNGDMPCISSTLLESLINHHTQTKANLTFVTAQTTQRGAYGIVQKTTSGIRVVEARNYISTKLESSYCINAGIYLFDKTILEFLINHLAANNVTQEFYITTLIEHACNERLKVETVSASLQEIHGVNTLHELWQAEKIKNEELIHFWMNNGVRFFNPSTVSLDYNIHIEPETTIGSGVHLKNGSIIGRGCVIEPFSILDNTKLANSVHIKSHSYLIDTIVHQEAQVGPFAHVRNSILHPYAALGNFVEAVRSTIGKNSKAKHLTYLGDATLEEKVNIGAGTITCNYDGNTKHPTHIKKESFIGSNTTIIAPVTIGDKSVTGAGSVITDNIPNNTLALARSRQINKINYYEECKKENQNLTTKPTYMAAKKNTNTFSAQE